MALARTQSVHTYSSSAGGQEYLFDVVVDAQDVVSVRNIRSPYGLIQDTLTNIPGTVIDDMDDAKALVTLLALEATVDSGNVVFTGQTTQPVVVAGGVLNNTNYRVVYTTSDGTILTTSSKTTTGFSVDAATTYGSVGAPKTVGYSVLVNTSQASDLSGVMTIADTDAGEKALVFATPLATASYRVILEARGLFDAHIKTQSTTGFTIELGHVPPAATSVTVGYDVFV